MPLIKKQPVRTNLVKKNYDAEVYAIAIGTNIFHWRKYRGLSQQDLAKKTGITQASISEIESGDGNPTTETISKIAHALQVPLDMITQVRIVWKMIEAVEYMAQKINDIDTLKAMKLLYFADLEAREKHGTKLIGLQYVRWNRGPFNQDIYQLDKALPRKNTSYKSAGFKTYLALSPKDQQFLDIIIHTYGNLTAVELMNKSYQTAPMKKYKKGDDKGLGDIVL